MKYLKFTLFGVLLAATAIAVWFIAPAIIFVMMIPPVCNEGKDADRYSTNSRGDIVAEYIKVCSAVGTFVDYSITLQLNGAGKAIKLGEHSDVQEGYPKFLWINDDRLMIDLGKVSWVESLIYNLGGVKITYVYSMGGP
jgi:hypothetical protein